MNDATQPDRGKTLAVTGAIFLLGPFIGVAGTVVGMLRTFQSLGRSSDAANPQALSDNIGLALTTTAIGLGFAIVGLVLVCLALFGARYRAPWLFWYIVLYGILLLFQFPMGTLFGIVVLGWCTARKPEFLAPATRATAVDGNV